MAEERRLAIINDLNARLGSDPKNFKAVYDIQKEYLNKKTTLDSSLSLANNEIPSKVSAAIEKSQKTSETIRELRNKLDAQSVKNNEFLASVDPLKERLEPLVNEIKQLEAAKEYLESLDTVQRLNQELHACNDSEQSVLLIQQLYDLQKRYRGGHRGDFISETAHYWYNVLKEKLTKEFDEVLKLIKWPITSSTLTATSTIAPESYNKFKQIVQYLLQIQMPPDDKQLSGHHDKIELSLSLPVKLMIAPLKKRFTFHFSGNRRTNRPDRPEWFLTQILSWLRDHLPFLIKNLQPIIDNSDYRVNVQLEFTCGLVQLAVDQLYPLLVKISNDDALFSHAIDECLGFDRELENVVNFILPLMCPRVVSVLTDARYFTRWLTVEKKLATQKIDEMLRGDDWLLPLGSTAVNANDDSEKIPQGADWLISLLQTIHDRYSILPQPGHRLQFLELQIELCEEIRVRLTQLIGEELRNGTSNDGGRTLEGSSRLLAMLNVVHIFKQALLDWTHCVSYLQLHYYKKQFQCFTELQHIPIPDLDTTPKHKPNRRGSILLSQVETDAEKLAQEEVEHPHLQHLNPNSNTNDLDESETGVFDELPVLFNTLIDNACSLLSDDLVLEVKAASRDYRQQKWHYLPEVSDLKCLSLSPALCAPLGALSNRLMKLHAGLAPEIFSPLWRAVAKEIDSFIFEEVIKDCWWGTGGIQQFNFDMTRNLMPIFAQYTSSPEAQLQKIAESCKLLTMLRGTAMLIKDTIATSSGGNFAEFSIKHLTPTDIIHVLNQRVDLNQN